MSMYNAVFGTNPWAKILMQALGIDEEQVPRFRDCFLDEKGRIAIHTRTGGGNRDYYEDAEAARHQGDEDPAGPFNSDLRKLDGFLYDRDDDFDSTYATFYFSVPEAFQPVVSALKDLGAVNNPGERWAKMIDGLRSGNKTADTRRAGGRVDTPNNPRRSGWRRLTVSLDLLTPQEA